ncbi:uroporphyrinogen-III C-methyltransferase [Chryseobacterium sp.]|uniref:uroporphyrinogen-III C-methyltransferase n=1 Tax=Chryseobacterium sp. TaxID=1871047 RepID=UPI0025BE332E|nr:uroporphyrinogen-III C-methyltransferase [Chryseobacterium sp.]
MIKGKVYLIGAGPGDPDLITVKAIKALQKSDVVLVDRLVSSKILEDYFSGEIIHVGKECRRGASTPQSTINDMIVQYALEGKTVSRLKGGDVSIFSNVLDELKVLKIHSISYEIIPGITAALGAASYSGIPLTAREYSTAVRFMTYYKSDLVNDEYWKDLAQTKDTLVFYMSVATLPKVIEKLKRENVLPDKKIAIIEQATTPLQRVHTCSFEEYESTLKDKKFISPSLVIIGSVVELHDQFHWLENNSSEDQYFPPVEKLNNYLTYKYVENAV